MTETLPLGKLMKAYTQISGVRLEVKDRSLHGLLLAPGEFGEGFGVGARVGAHQTSIVPSPGFDRLVRFIHKRVDHNGTPSCLTVSTRCDARYFSGDERLASSNTQGCMLTPVSSRIG